MVLGDAAKARRQFVLHAKTRKSRQDHLLVVVAQLVIAESAVVTRDAVLTASRIDTLMLRDRCDGMERDRVPNCLCTALPHIVRESKGAAEVRSQNLKATIGSATARKAKIMQDHRHSNQFGIRSKSTMLGQLGSIEPRARHVVEKPRLRFCFCLCIGILNSPTVG